MIMKDIIKDFKKFSFFLKGLKKTFIIILVLNILMSVVSIVISTINALIIDNLVNKLFNVVFILIISEVILQLLHFVFNLLISKYFLKFRKQMTDYVRKYFLKVALNHKLGIYNEYNKNNSLNKVRSDSSRIAGFLKVMNDNFFAAITSVGSIIIICYFNVYIGLFFIICCVIAFSIRLYGIKA